MIWSAVAFAVHEARRREDPSEAAWFATSAAGTILLAPPFLVQRDERWYHQPPNDPPPTLDVRGLAQGPLTTIFRVMTDIVLGSARSRQGDGLPEPRRAPQRQTARGEERH